jgi:hypothetical protein
MDLDPVVWVIIILVVTALAGGFMFWSTKPRKNRSSMTPSDRR